MIQTVSRKKLLSRLCLLGVIAAPPVAQSQTSATKATAVPSTGTRCAVDFGACSLPRGATGGSIYYGANGTYVVTPVPITSTTSTIPLRCEPNTFGGQDPVPNVQKSCFFAANVGQPTTAITRVSAVPSGATKCAVDFGNCAMPFPWAGGTVYYGANGTFLSAYQPARDTPTFICSPAALKVADPVPNVQKTCSYVPGPTTQAASTTPTAQPTPATPSPSAPTTPQKGTVGWLPTGENASTQAYIDGKNVTISVRDWVKRLTKPDGTRMQDSDSINTSFSQPNGRAPATVLHYAAWACDKQMVRWIINDGGDAEYVDPRTGGTPLHWAARMDCGVGATGDDLAAIVDYLVDNSRYDAVNIRDKSNFTALAYMPKTIRPDDTWRLAFSKQLIARHGTR